MQITNPLIVTNKCGCNLPFIRQLQHHLHAAGIPSAVFGHISPNPRDLTAWTGADALTHAVEAYLVPGCHPLCDGLALEVLAWVAQWRPVAEKEPDNIEARGGILVGLCLAGIAFLKGLGLVHATSHMIGAEFKTQHGRTNAIVLSVDLRFNLPGREEKVKRMSDSLGIDDHSVVAFTIEVERILDEIDIPQSLAEIGVPADRAQRIAEKALLDSAGGTNPRPGSVDEVRDLVTTALHKARNGNGSHGY